MENNENDSYEVIDIKKQKREKRDETKIDIEEIKKKEIFDLTEREFVSRFKYEISDIYNRKRILKDDSSVAPIWLQLLDAIFLFAFMTGIPVIGLIVMLKDSSSDLFAKIWVISLVSLSVVLSIFGFFYTISRILNKKHSRLFIFKDKRTQAETPYQKGVFKEAIFNMLGLKYSSFKPGLKRFLGEIFGVYSHVEEIFTGVYHGMPFDIVDQSSVYGVNSVIFITKISKPFTWDIRIWNAAETKSFLFSSVNKDPSFQLVNLEDVNFAREYKTFAQDQVEARYLLTPAFLERVKRYRNVKLCDIEIAFSQKYPQFGNVFFHIKTGMDMFEFPPNNIYEMEARAKAVYNILFEIKDILKIVDTLKLDQDIGM